MRFRVQKYEKDIVNPLSAGGTSRQFLLVVSPTQIKGYIPYFQNVEL